MKRRGAAVKTSCMDADLPQQTRSYFKELIRHFYEHGGEFAESIKEAQEAAERAGIAYSEMHKIMLKEWIVFADDALSDGVLTDSEMVNLSTILDELDMDVLEVKTS
ncbi:MAG: hypothetical protein AAF357_10360, partial [Verrucomicrobiota bacterium]